MSRPKLLFLSQALPYPPDAGVKIRTFHVLKSLARDFDIAALCFYRWKPGLYEEDLSKNVAALQEYGEVEPFPIPQEHDRRRLLWDHARSLLTFRVYTVFTYDSAEFRNRLHALLRERRFDLVHMDSLDLSGYLDELGGLPVVCVHHDAQSVLLRRRAEVQDSAVRRAYLRHQARLMEREERNWCPRVSLNVTVSHADERTLEALAPSASFKVVRNGVDVNYFRPREEPESGIVFVGGTTPFPNKDALEYFGEGILPLIRARWGEVSTLWVGRCGEEERLVARDRFGIDLTGYLDDIRPYVARAACYVVPLRVGSGTRIKILDAWAMGKAVVSTSVGCEGLEARDGENILIRDDEGEFADAVADLLGDEELRGRLGAAARDTAVTMYSWEVIGRDMNREYLDLIDAYDAPLAERRLDAS